jgi:ankyrin repeat protein
MALLEHGASVNAAHPTKRRTVLMRAAARGDVAIVDRLLRAGADVAAVDRQGRSALDHVAPDAHDVIELLVGRGAVRRGGG